MVNPGHRSRGCAPCRRAKVACDLEKPSCGRCVRTRRICTGYVRDAEFRSMNAVSEAKVRQRMLTDNKPKPRSQRATSAPPQDGGDATTLETTLPPRPRTDWTAQSVTIFFAENVVGPDRERTIYGSLEYLPAMYNKGRAAYLTDAVQAAALANVGYPSSIPEISQMAKRAYGKSLFGLRQAIADSTRLTNEETLAAIYVLGIYEMITGQKPLAEIFHAHFHGQSAILHKTKKDSAKRNSLFSVTNLTLMWRDLAAGTCEFFCVSEWPPMTYSSSLTDTNARLTVEIVNVCGRVRELSKNQQPADTSWLERYDQLAADAMQLHLEVQKYVASPPDQWRAWSLPQRFNSPFPLVQDAPIRNLSMLVSPAQGLAEDEIHPEPLDENVQPAGPVRIDVYANIAIAYTWTTLRCAWTHLLRAIIDLHLIAFDCNLQRSVDLPSTDTCCEAIGTIIQDICAATPFLVGDVDQDGNISLPANPRTAGFWLLWVLHRVCMIPNLDPSIRAWVIQALERMGESGLGRGKFLAKLHKGHGSSEYN